MQGIRKLSRTLLDSPARTTPIGFLVLIIVGTLLLTLPLSARRAPISLLDALFTATSASCVTGLVVVDTGSYFAPFGQVVILLMIQIGGLGIMTLSTLSLLMAGRRLSLAGQIAIQDTFTHSGDRTPKEILVQVIGFTLFMEAAGAIILFFRFLPNHGLSEAGWLAVFHSVSAFCNAGFGLFSDSLAGYREDWILNLTVCTLIVFGGIGFLVISELRSLFSAPVRGLKRLSLHSKLVLSTTLILIFAGTLLILIMEWHNTLLPLSRPGRLLAALFQSITARTAGFNTLPIDTMANETLLVLILLMFIGASPGSCGGGIKTTTFAALAVLGIARLRGRNQAQAFYRTISDASTAKATSLAMLSALVVIVATLALMMSEVGEVSHVESRGKFLEYLFETVSAFGTVGLSMGVTSGMTSLGKLIITAVMFIGRLGPLMLAIAISRQSAPKFRYAEEKVMIG